MLTAIPSDMKYQLEDLHFNYMNVNDYDLFLFLAKGLKQEQTSLLLGDLDLSKMELSKDETNGEIVLVDLVTGARIDRLVHHKMVEFIRKIHGIKPKIENASNETTRQILIQLDRDKAKRAAKEGYKSTLKPIISGLMRVPSCTMSLKEIMDLPLYALMDTIMGAQVFVNTNALLTGSYSGMVDTSKINKKEFDWMRDIREENANISDKQENNKDKPKSKAKG